jgi:hypothetical protein
VSRLACPTVHLNGSAGEVLLAQAQNAARAVYDAMAALALAGPNARDYPPQRDSGLQDDAGVWRMAVREHDARMTKLRAVYTELLEIGQEIEGQIDARSARRKTRTR